MFDTLENTDTSLKKYYKIGEVAEMLGVNQSTLRFWEKEFPQCHPSRTRSGQRCYTPQDLERFKIIKFLVKEKGLKIEAAKEQLRVNSDNVFKRREIIETLTEVRDNLKNLAKALSKRNETFD